MSENEDAARAEAESRWVGEGPLSASALGMAPLGWGAIVPSAASLALAAIGIVVNASRDVTAFFVVLALLLQMPRAVGWLRFTLARRGPEVWQRITVSEEGIVVASRRGEAHAERRYDWFMFEHHVVEPHRVLLWLRTPSVPGRKAAEVVLIPRAFFADDWTALVALVAEHVKPPAAPAPAPPASPRKTMLLWLALIGLLVVAYALFARQ